MAEAAACPSSSRPHTSSIRPHTLVASSRCLHSGRGSSMVREQSEVLHVAGSRPAQRAQRRPRLRHLVATSSAFCVSICTFYTSKASNLKRAERRPRLRHLVAPSSAALSASVFCTFVLVRQMLTCPRLRQLAAPSSAFRLVSFCTCKTRESCYSDSITALLRLH